MSQAMATLECAPLTDHEVVSATGREMMNALAEWSVEIVSPQPVSLDKVLREAATLRLADDGDGSLRVVRLVVTDIAEEGDSRDGHRYTLSLAPPEWLATLRAGYRVFVDKTTQEIVDSVLHDLGTLPERIQWRLSGTYMKRLHTVQYAETDWAFMTRLLAEEGIAFWFDSTDHGPLFVFGDDAGSHDGIAPPTHVPFEDASGMVGARHFFELELAERMTETAVHVRDFDIRNPDVLIEGRAGSGARELFEYPAKVLTKDAAERRAKVRLEQLTREALVAIGRSDCVRIQPGHVLDVEGCAEASANARYLVTEVSHDYRRPAPNAPAARPYRNTVRMVPAKKTYRPAVPQHAPRAPGLETAFTTGPRGEEIHVDDLGRVKLRFPWDRSGTGDDRSSTWFRTMQMNMGGAMLLPRVGWEVPVMYMHGDPDRPVVLGRVYNGSQVVPYALPGGAATTTLQSATSPGGGSTNEIRAGDAKGGMEFFVHASKDQTVAVGGSATTKVGADETHDVGLSHAVSIGGGHDHSVGGAQSVNVGTAMNLSVAGGRTEMIGGMESIGVDGNRGVSTGAYTEIVGGAHALQCNQANTHVSGAFLELVGGVLKTNGGASVDEEVAAARTELVSGSRTIKAGTYAEQVTGAKTISAGAATDKAGAKVVTTAKAGGKVSAASVDISAGGPVVISAPTITLDVSASITAGALEIGGGTLKCKSGTTKLKGPIKRNDKAEME